MSNMMLGWRNHAENATLASSTPAQTDAGVSKVVNRRVAKAFRAKASSRRQMSITLDLGLTYSQNLARVMTLTRHVLGTRGRFRIQAGNVADLGDPALHLDFLTNTLDDRITFTRASTATYFDADGVLQSAAVDTARFDHHPVTGARRGLLVEGAGTNLILQSQNFATSWTAGNAQVVPNVETAPDGTTTADLLIENGTAAVAHNVAQAVTISAGATVSGSVFLKPAGRHRARVYAFGASGSLYVDVNLSTGATGTATATGVYSAATVRLLRLRNGWFRVAVSGVTATDTSITFAVYMLSGAGAATYDGDTLSGMLLWGAQLEASSFPTSYMPTTSAAASRSADVATVSGSSFTSWFVPGPGTIEADGEFAHLGAFETVLSINDGTGNNTFLLRKHGSTNDLNFDVVTGGVVQASLSNTLGAVGRFGVAAAWAGKDFASSVNGRTSVTAAAGSLPVVTQMTIGQQAASGNPLNSHLRSIAYRPRRVENGRLEAWTNRGATINTDFAACDVDLPVEYTFTRASGGGYVDALGRLQGQYPAITAPIVPQTTREERVKNGGFDSDALWTKNTGWTIGSGVASKSVGAGDSIHQNASLIPGQTFRLRYEITSISANSVIPILDGVGFGTARTATGLYEETFVAAAATQTIGFYAPGACSIDNVSVTLDQGLKIPVGAGQDVKVGQLLRIEPQDATANTYMLGKVVAYDGAIVTVDVVEAAAPELADGGHFTSTAGGFTMGGGTQAVVSGELEITSDGSTAYGGATDAVTLAVGATYVFEGEIRVGTAANVRLLFDYGSSLAASGNVTTSTAVRHILVATADGTAGGVNFQFVSAPPSAGHTAYGDNMSLKRAHTAWIVSLAGPRFTHDTDGTALGLLVEPAATNVMTVSEDTSTNNLDTGWALNSLTRTSVGHADPFGRRAATLFTASGGSATHNTTIRRSAIASPYTSAASVFVKAGAASKVRIECRADTLAHGGYADVNLATGTLITTGNSGSGTVSDTLIQPLADGWYRIGVAADHTSASNGLQIIAVVYILDNSGAATYTPASTAESLYVTGLQIETGSVATSYIPTFGVSRTRSADVCTIEGDEFLARYRQDEGAFYTAWRAPSYGTNGSIQRGIFGAYADINNRLGLLLTDNNPNAVRGQVVASGTGYALIDNTYTANSDVRTVLAYAADDIELVVDGSSVGTDTSATLPTVSSFGIGNRAGDNYFIGTISRLIFWPERRATADLVAMTTSGADLDAYTIPGTLADAYAGTYDSDWLDAWVGGHAATDLGANEATLRLILAADVAYRYWRIDQYDHPGPDADPAGADDAVTLEAGYLGLWRVWQPALNPVYGFQDILEARTRVLESWSGSEDFERRDPARALTPSWDYLSEADMKIARQIMRYADTDTPMYFILDPAEADDWIESDILCRLQSLTAIEAAVFERFSMAFRLKQWA